MADIYLNGATIMTTPTPRQLQIAHSAGFRGIEARAERLLGNPAEVEATAALAANGDVWSLNGVRIGLSPNGSLLRDQLEVELGARLDVCQAIGAAYLLAVPPRVAGLLEADALRGMREGLRLAGDQAAERGVGLAFEFLGFVDCPIATPRAAAAAVAELEGVDLVIDSCHWHASGSGAVDAIPVDRLAMVHLNDAPAKPPAEIEDADRVLPGEGVIRLRELIGGLRGRGYQGPWSLETFNPTLWEEDPQSVAERGRATIVGYMAAAG